MGDRLSLLKECQALGGATQALVIGKMWHDVDPATGVHG